MLQFFNVTHRYGSRPSLQAVDLTVRRGDCYGFLGPNGAGKTTALRIAVGLIRARRGQVLVDGVDARDRATRARIGALIEAPRFFEQRTAHSNLMAVALASGMTRRQASHDMERVLELIGLEAEGTRRVATFSQGMRQRLGVAQAMLGRPPYLLLDEPQNGLDPEGIAKLRSVLRALCDSGTAVLLSSHQLHEVQGLCNRVGLLREGRLLVEAPLAELLADTRHRWRIEAEQPQPVQAALQAAGIRASNHATGSAIEVELDDDDTRPLFGALSASEVPVRSVAPLVPTLESVYLNWRDHMHSAPAASTPAVAAPMTAPGFSVLRAARWELRRLARPRMAVTSLVAPLVPAVISLAALRTAAAANAEQVQSGTLFSATTTTGVDAMARGLQSGLPVAALMLTAIGSQTLAGELGAGTLRNLLMRPISRTQVVLGKTLALVAAATAVFSLLIVVTAVLAGAWFGFGDLQEIYAGAEADLVLTAAELSAVITPLVAWSGTGLLAFLGLGIVVSAWSRRGVTALAVSLAMLPVLDYCRVLLHGSSWQGWLPTAHVPSPFQQDQSIVQYSIDFASGHVNAMNPHGAMVPWVSLAWFGAGVVIATLSLRARSIP